MVGAAGIEPATAGLEIRCSIRLSYAPAVWTNRFILPAVAAKPNPAIAGDDSRYRIRPVAMALRA